MDFSAIIKASYFLGDEENSSSMVLSILMHDFSLPVWIKYKLILVQSCNCENLIFVGFGLTILLQIHPCSFSIRLAEVKPLKRYLRIRFNYLSRFGKISK
jgi:hypothetical protein